jgi:hypothetical protein
MVSGLSNVGRSGGVAPFRAHLCPLPGPPSSESRRPRLRISQKTNEGPPPTGSYHCLYIRFSLSDLMALSSHPACWVQRTVAGSTTCPGSGPWPGALRARGVGTARGQHAAAWMASCSPGAPFFFKMRGVQRRADRFRRARSLHCRRHPPSSQRLAGSHTPKRTLLSCDENKIPIEMVMRHHFR